MDPEHGEHHHGHGQGIAVAPEKPFTDPVCGMKVSPDPEREVSFGAETYHFCSQKCMDKFKAVPKAYVGPRTLVEEAAAPAGTIYTCPMHPEVSQDKPGNCPICGMTLEPVMPSLDEEENPELVDFRRRFWWTLPLTVVATVLAMFGHQIFPEGLRGQSWIEFAIGSPVVLYAGWPFFVRCIESLKNRSPNMWTLIGIGTFAAYAYAYRRQDRHAD